MMKFSMNFKANFKDAIKKDSLIDSVSAVLTPIVYIALPSLLKLSGWTAWGVGGGATWLIGALFNIPAMRTGAIATMATHLAYAKFSGDLKNWGVPVWTMTGVNDFNPQTQTQTQTGVDGLRSLRGLRNNLQPNSNVLSLPTGQQVISRPMSGLRGYDNESALVSGGLAWNKNKSFKVN